MAIQNATKEQWDRANKAEDACRRHVKRCRDCYHPIIDDEGNPGYFGEACGTGVKLLRAYVDATNAVLDA